MTENNFTIIIPSRYGSTRMPGKSLVNIKGKSMIRRVYEQCSKSNANKIIIATDDDRIKNEGESFGAEVVLTSKNHRSGTDRIFEVAKQLNMNDDEIIINVQGDEPLIPPTIINQVANNISTSKNIEIATLCAPIQDEADFINPNIVKVTRDLNDLAQLFSRAPIPFNKNWKNLNEISNLQKDFGSMHLGYRHIGIYAYTFKALKSYVSLDQTKSEINESLEQLRALDNGMKIHCDLAYEIPPHGIDTVDDLSHLISHLEKM